MTMSDSQKWLVLAAALLLLSLIYLLAPVLTPFIAAAFLAYLGDPLADRLEAVKIGRTWAVVIVFSVIFSVLTLVAVLLLPMLESQLSYLFTNLPKYFQWLQHELLPTIAEKLQLDPQSFNIDAVQKSLTEEWRKAGNIVLGIFKSISSSGVTVMAWFGNMLLIPVVTFYLLRDWDILVGRVHLMLPRKVEPVISKLTRESDEVQAAFLRGQFMVMLSLGAIYSLGLWMAGLKLALLIGLLAGLVSFVPYLGFIVGIIAAGIAMLLQTQDLFQLVPVVVVFGVGQALEGMLLTPLLVGDRIGLHPVAVIFAVLAGGQLFGFIGILLALPTAAVIAVILRHAHGQYLISTLYEDSSKPPSE